eukprot:gene8157-9581_t
MGFNVETIYFYNKLTNSESKFTMWDVGHTYRNQSFWDSYCDNTQAFIIVVDSTANLDQMKETSGIVETILKDQTHNDASLLFYYNKQDLPNAKSPEEITLQLGLNNLLSARKWHVQPIVAVDMGNQGIIDSLDWLSCSLRSM